MFLSDGMCMGTSMQELTRLRILEVKGINVKTAPSTPSRKAKATPLSKGQETDTDTEGGLTPVLA